MKRDNFVFNSALDEMKKIIVKIRDDNTSHKCGRILTYLESLRKKEAGK